MGAKARAKEAGPGAISPTAAGSAGGEAEMKADVAMPLAPHVGAVGKVKQRGNEDDGDGGEYELFYESDDDADDGPYRF